MISYYKRTKIVATLGPAITQKIWSLEMLNDPQNKAMVKLAYQKMTEIIESGVNCVRLNFSHGDHNEHLVRIKIARDVAKKLNRYVSVMLDTKGPEIRVGKIKTGKALIKIGTKVTVNTLKPIVGDTQSFYATDSTGKYNMANDVKVGGTILVDDGKLQLSIDAVDKINGIIKTIAKNTHTISDKKRINLPNTAYSIPFLSPQDKDDILFGIKHKVDYIAASFVNNADNIAQIRQVLDDNGGGNIQIISKIESTNAIDNLDQILDATNGVMVARGDLALEIPYYDVPYWEKYIIRKCRYIGKPVIIATQMLDSLEKNIQPTRAEVTDVFFAVERGADATMLSGESANGLFPTFAVQTMREIDVKSELLFDYKRAIEFYFPKAKLVSYAKRIAKKIAKKLLPFGDDAAPSFPYGYVVIFSNDKPIIWTLSNIRPAATIIVVTDDEELLTCFGINYAIQTYYVKDLNQAKTNPQKIALAAIKQYQHNNEAKTLIYCNRKFQTLT
ncbi:MAG: pyruvate kinase [Mycoplasmataceae bacterium]|nr:pyruvate kinase [Mycoplasmataceae bacterium]